MAKRTSRKKDSTIKEPLIMAFIIICFMLILTEVGTNLVNEINYGNDMKALVVAHE